LREKEQSTFLFRRQFHPKIFAEAYWRNTLENHFDESVLNIAEALGRPRNADPATFMTIE